MSTRAIATQDRFFVAGGTLRPDARCYVRRAADEQIYRALSTGDFAYVLTSRQMGKSSLMVRTAGRLRLDGFVVAVLDLTALGSNLNADQWYYGLAEKMAEQFDFSESRLLQIWLEQKPKSPLQRWLAFTQALLAQHSTARFVVFVDEIDAVLSLPFSTDEFFATIRHFYNRRSESRDFDRITFCLLGVAAPSDLIQDPETTPFNIGVRIELQDFRQDEAAPLGEALAPDGHGTRLLFRVMYWTGGHPYLTQRLCAALVERGMEFGAKDVDATCAKLFLGSRPRDRDDNLLFVRERLLHNDVDTAALLTLYRRIWRGRRVRDSESNRLVTVLRLSGVCRSKDGLLRVRNRIYAHTFNSKWIEETMPGAERRRQRAAFRRGLLLATGVALGVLGIIGFLGYIALEQRNENRRQLYISDINLAEQASEAHDSGRVLQLLGRHIPQLGEPDLRGFEWYKLWNEASAIEPIRQIDLPEDTANVFASTDGRTIFSAENMEVVERELESGARLRTVLHSLTPITRFVMSEDRHILALGDSNGALRLWDEKTGSELGGPAPVSLPNSRDWFSESAYIRFSPDDRFVVIALGQTVTLWQIPEWKVIASQKINGDLRSVALSPDGRRIGIATRNSVQIWSNHFEKRMVTFPVNQPGAIVFWPDGTCVAVGDYGAIHLFSLRTGQETWRISTHGFFASVALSSDGKQVFSSGQDGTARIWDLHSNQQTAIFQANADGGVLVLFFDGKRLVTAGDVNHQIRVWDVTDEAPEMGNGDEVYTIAFSPDGSRFASGGNDGTVLAWDSASHKQISRVDQRERIRSVDFLDGSTILVNSMHEATLWNLATSRVERTLTRSSEPVFAALSPDRSTVAIAEAASAEVLLYKLGTAEPVEVLRGGTFADRGTLIFAPDNQTLAFSAGGRVCIWTSSADPTRVLQVKAEALALAFSPDGKQLLVGQTGNLPILVWDWHRNSIVRELSGARAAVKSLQFSPDGSRLAATADDGTVRFWDGKTFDPILTIDQSDQSVETLAFSPDGRFAAVAGDDREIRLWDGSRHQ